MKRKSNEINPSVSVQVARFLPQLDKYEIIPDVRIHYSTIKTSRQGSITETQKRSLEQDCESWLFKNMFDQYGKHFVGSYRFLRTSHGNVSVKYKYDGILNVSKCTDTSSKLPRYADDVAGFSYREFGSGALGVYRKFSLPYNTLFRDLKLVLQGCITEMGKLLDFKGRSEFDPICSRYNELFSRDRPNINIMIKQISFLANLKDGGYFGLCVLVVFFCLLERKLGYDHSGLTPSRVYFARLVKGLGITISGCKCDSDTFDKKVYRYVKMFISKQVEFVRGLKSSLIDALGNKLHDDEFGVIFEFAGIVELDELEDDEPAPKK